jgi:hypothetical protein
MKLTVIFVILMTTGCSALPPSLSEQAFKQALSKGQYQNLGQGTEKTQSRVYVNDRPTGISIR